MATTIIAQHGARAVVFHLLLQIYFTVGLLSFEHSAGALITASNNSPPAETGTVPCLPDQASALLRLKLSFTTTNYSLDAFRSWRAGTDCCRWVGVLCGGGDGRVTSLDLGNRKLESTALDPALFDLTSLKYLNLAHNNFNWSQLPPSEFTRLIELTHLNLSGCSFSGQVPTSIGSLMNLVSLDLSTSFHVLEFLGDGHVSYPVPEMWIRQQFEHIFANLSNLRELHLGLVDLSDVEKQWCNILAKSCPRLQVLRLPSCRLFGPICTSLSRLHSLAIIDLEHNSLSGPLPDFFPNFPNLTVLQLKHNLLQGWMSPEIFQHNKLVTIDLYNNFQISGYLPKSSFGSRLENLNVGKTNFSGIIPSSLGSLMSLKTLGLGASGFSGVIPTSISNLTSLNTLEIAGMGIVGPIPSWVANLTNLTTLQFYDCSLSGSIPFFISNLRYLKKLALCSCSFSGEIPPHIANLTQLQILLLYSNYFIGTTELSFFGKLPYLIALDLSDNNLFVIDGEHNSSLSSAFPKIILLGLNGCNMHKFPNFLMHQDEINWMDLSDNKIHGAIPQWAWETWNYLFFLILAGNKFTSVGYSSLLPIEISLFDLSNNLFEGTIPIPQGSSNVLDYSNNRFSSIPSNFGSHLSDVTLFTASSNELSGKIPSSFCGGTSIQLLDLSYNSFNGSIPSCLMDNVNGLQSLYLNENRINGEFPDNIMEGCSFVALDFSGNWIEGKLPRSLLACTNLEVLDAGNNQISDSFPCWMSTLHALEVVVLKSNKLFGRVAQSIADEKNNCTFPSATIVDLSSNNFSGPLPQGQWFQGLKSMALRNKSASLVMDHQVPNTGTKYTYAYKAAVTYKGHDTTFAKILRTLVFIDFSNNHFHGSIPEAIGELGLLHGLNISHNFLSGPIPSKLGQLRQLEALDLSFNNLSGEIPQELASLDFLTTLNLSYNKLDGSIPVSPHFQTFLNTSFIGNDGLCGLPLSKGCINTTSSKVVPHHSRKKSENFMTFLFAGLGFGVGFATAIVLTLGYPSANDLDRGNRHSKSCIEMIFFV